MFSRLPTPPSPEQLQQLIPGIPPVPEEIDRPMWSVMIPTYNCADYLRKTLESVLSQDPGPELMQIEVIDDASTKDDPEAVTKEVGKGRVQFFRQRSNQGATRTFNECIRRSRGHWVHILHGDDMVNPGFYDAYSGVIEAVPHVVMVLGPVITIDEEDRWLGIIGPQRGRSSMILADFVSRQATTQLVQFAGTVVRRSAYERAGGFCTYFNHSADWDMWYRIGLLGSVGIVDKPSAMYRLHAASDTSRLRVLAEDVRESCETSLINMARANPPISADSIRAWRRSLSNHAMQNGYSLGVRGSLEGRLNQARWAWRIWPCAKTLRFIVKSYIKYVIK